VWTIDLKDKGTIYAGPVRAPAKAGVTLLLSDDTFEQLATGKVCSFAPPPSYVSLLGVSYWYLVLGSGFGSGFNSVVFNDGRHGYRLTCTVQIDGRSKGVHDGKTQDKRQHDVGNQTQRGTRGESDRSSEWRLTIDADCADCQGQDQG